MKRILTLLTLIAVFAVYAVAADAVAVFKLTPAMSCENCEAKVKSGLSSQTGIKKVITSPERQTVAVTYDAKKTSPEAIVKSLGKMGYNAERVTSEKSNSRRLSPANGAKAVKASECERSCKKSTQCRPAKSDLTLKSDPTMKVGTKATPAGKKTKATPAAKATKATPAAKAKEVPSK